MLEKFLGLWENISARRKNFLKTLFVLAIVFVIFNIAFIEYSAQPRFCRTCHYMRPFYNAWEKSTHKNVPCVKCHYAPTFGATALGKFKASVQLVKYVTGQYGTKPWTEIEDASCLRSGCHEKRLLKGQVDFNGVNFDHTPHLTTFRRVTRMKCTSCHSQIVQGTHISVTPTTCFLCHFKNIPEEEGIANCTWCHKKLPDVQLGKNKNIKFSHQDAIDRGIDCLQCHFEVTRGTGDVPKERCFSCHSEPEKIKKYKDTIFMHNNHVTKHKVDCVRCHLEIQHSLPNKETIASPPCESCHTKNHENEKQLYMGKGGQGVKNIPADMFVSNVSCSGCHIGHKVLPRGLQVKTGEMAGCLTCHEEKFGRNLNLWKNEQDVLLNSVISQFEKVRIKVRNAYGSVVNKKNGLTLLWQAQDNINLVENGNAVHNYPYAEALLEQAVDSMNLALKVANAKGVVNLPKLKKVSYLKSKCFDCHNIQDIPDKQIYGVTFPHRRHIKKLQQPCERCHSSSFKPQEPNHGSLNFSQEGCRQCHRYSLKNIHDSGWIYSHKVQTNIEPCAVCHLRPICSACHYSRKPKSHMSNWWRRHGNAALGDGSCKTCHSKKFCASCHKIPMPHSFNWIQIHGKQAEKNGELCGKCHNGKLVKNCIVCHKTLMPSSHKDNQWKKVHGKIGKNNSKLCLACHNYGKQLCIKCHNGLQMPHNDDWIGTHKKYVLKNPQTCKKCHTTPDFCYSCHEGNPPASHSEKWDKNHSVEGKKNPTLCTMCHKGNGNFCTTCHGGVSMPHSDDWVMIHKETVASKGKEVCYKCHKDKEEFCSTCH